MKSLVKSLIRILSIYIIAKSLLEIPQFMTMYGMYNLMSNHSNGFIYIKNLFIIYVAFELILVIAIGLLLWLFTNKITEMIVEKTNDNISLNSNYLLKTAISVVGLVILISSIPNIASHIAGIICNPILFDNTLNDTVSEAGLYQNITSMVLFAVKGALGILLMVYSKAIAKLINKESDIDISNMDQTSDIHIINRNDDAVDMNDTDQANDFDEKDKDENV